MMTRQRITALREHAQAAQLINDADELAVVVTELLSAVEAAQLREHLLRGDYMALLAAARASIAAEQCCEAAPLVFLRAELDRHGQLPAAGERAMRVLADATTTQALIAHRADRLPIGT
ncbi:hypothetical protein [Planobispora takensis]|uniref:Uncharacterized protein n=1 Tax=Planobispora takensis TaxID=1367882 RepID=A0A8J3T2I6_9ACTN|nr:hypothetical protein [Planobispora takensis]GII03093.1 hypothetical protein Pta02_51010 [Planobispora takensis]